MSTPSLILFKSDVCIDHSLRYAASAKANLQPSPIRRICCLLGGVLLFLLPVQWTWAAEPDDVEKHRVFYVRQTVGDDAHDGLSPDRAWRSISMLGNALRAGDTAYVGPGLYREEVVLANSGTADAWITLIADKNGAHTCDPT